MAVFYRHDLAKFFLLAVLLYAAPVIAGPQVPCNTVKNVEAMNKGGISRLFELRGVEAKVFLALDPRLLMFEEKYHALMQQDIDAIVTWELIQRGGRLAGAVPFASGCAVDGYGEPDLREKIELMRDVVVLIGKRGLDDARVLDKIKELFAFEPIRMDPEELEKRVAQIIERVHGLYELAIGAAAERGDLDEVK